MQLKDTGLDRAATFTVDSSVKTFCCRLDIAQTRLRFGPPLTWNAPLPPHREVSWSSRITYTFTCFGPMDVRRRHSTSVAIWPPLMDTHAPNFFILLSHLCVSCAVPLPVVSSFTVICDVIFPIWNTLGILWCPFLMLVINSFDAHIRVSFSSFKEKRDKVWFILQWSRNLYSVDADTGDSALQIHKIQSMNLFLFKGTHCYHELHVQGSPTDICSFEVLWDGCHFIRFFFVALYFTVFLFVFRKWVHVVTLGDIHTEHNNEQCIMYIF